MPTKSSNPPTGHTGHLRCAEPNIQIIRKDQMPIRLTTRAPVLVALGDGESVHVDNRYLVLKFCAPRMRTFIFRDEHRSNRQIIVVEHNQDDRNPAKTTTRTLHLTLVNTDRKEALYSWRYDNVGVEARYQRLNLGFSERHLCESIKKAFGKAVAQTLVEYFQYHHEKTSTG